MESVLSSFVVAIEKVIASREDKVLECVLTFQNQVIEELISIRQLLKKSCLCLNSTNRMDFPCKCSLSTDVNNAHHFCDNVKEYTTHQQYDHSNVHEKKEKFPENNSIFNFSKLLQHSKDSEVFQKDSSCKTIQVDSSKNDVIPLANSGLTSIKDVSSENQWYTKVNQEVDNGCENNNSIMSLDQNNHACTSDNKAGKNIEKILNSSNILRYSSNGSFQSNTISTNSKITDFHKIKTKKQFKCQKCGKNFSSKTTVQKHSRLHDGIRPFSCKTCGKSFSEKFSLKRHVMIHTGEKPFKCLICNKSYSRKDYRDLHMKLHLGNVIPTE